MSDNVNEGGPASERSQQHAEGLVGVGAERAQSDSELLRALAASVERNERAQEKFRNAVVRRLARLEARGRVLQASEFVDPHKCCSVSRAADAIEACEALISEISEEIERKMFEAISLERGAKDARRGRPRRWSGWKI